MPWSGMKNSDDLVYRLRHSVTWKGAVPHDNDLDREAADEIVRLREAKQGYDITFYELKAENDQLRKAIEAKFKINLKSPLLEGLVGGVFPDGVLLATICEAARQLADKDDEIKCLREHVETLQSVNELLRIQLDALMDSVG